MSDAFAAAIQAAYELQPDEPAIVLGSAMHDDAPVNDPRVQIPVSMLNRHGLIAGATGTGKTKTLQIMAGQLSDMGVPVFVADIKGDVTGMAATSDASNPKIQERCASIAFESRQASEPPAGS